MRVTLTSSLVITLVASSARAFAPVSQRWGWSLGAVRSNSAVETEVVSATAVPSDEDNNNHTEPSRVITPLTAAQINARLNVQLEKLKEKDRSSKRLQKNVS